MANNFPSIEQWVGTIAGQQAPSHHPDDDPIEIIRQRIRKENATAEWMRDIWNRFGDDRGLAKSIPFPNDAPAYGGCDPPRLNVRINIPRSNGTPSEKRGIFGHFDNAHVKPELFKKIGRTITQVSYDSHNKHILQGWGAYDMQGGNYGSFKGALEADMAVIEAETDIWCVCDEERGSSGTHALVRNEHARQLHCWLSPEVLVNVRKLRDRMIPFIIGRPGRFGMSVTCNGRGMHAGEVELEDQPYLTRSIERLVEDVLIDLGKVLKMHPDTSGGVELVPKVSIGKWHSEDEESLTLPSSSSVFVNVHYAHHENIASVVAQTFRDMIARAIHTRFPDDGDVEFRKRAVSVAEEEREMYGFGSTPFTEPWREAHMANPYFGNMKRLIWEGYEQALTETLDVTGFQFDAIQDILDTGVADEGILANKLMKPVGNVSLIGRYPHRPTEELDIRSEKYYRHTVTKYMEAQGQIAPSRW